MANQKGRLIKCLSGLYFIYTDDGRTVSCKAKGAFRHSDVKPLVGDRVTFDEGGFISEIETRRNFLIRPPVSNVSNLFIVIASAEPEPMLLNVDKLISVSEHNSVRPIIVITKCELDANRSDYIAGIYEKVGYKVFKTDSNGSGDDMIRTFIREECRENISCFCGASGVGKSTLMSRLFPLLHLETGELSQKIKRGKNTTRHVDLYPLRDLFGDGNDGFIADTPGFSMIDFIGFDFLDVDSLPNTFVEFYEYIGKCRYTKCTHLCEEGCAICDALKNGVISNSRHDSYVSMYNDLKDKHPWTKVRER